MFLLRAARVMLVFAAPAGSAIGCGSKTSPTQPQPNPVVFEDRLTVDENDDKSPLGISPAQLPALGACRLWHPGRPLREQPPAASCAQVEPTAPPDSWILYRPPQDPRLVHVRIVDPDRAGVVVRVRVYDAERGTYLGTKQRRHN